MGNTKSVGNKILGGLNKVVNPIMDFGRDLHHNIKEGLAVAKNMPILGDLVSAGLNVPIPELGGMSIGGVGNSIDKGFTAASNIGNAITGKPYDRGALQDTFSKGMTRIGLQLPPRQQPLLQGGWGPPR